MKKILIASIVLINFTAFAQEKETSTTFKKRVLENTEVDFLLSYYNQDGTHSPVNGGIGPVILIRLTLIKRPLQLPLEHQEKVLLQQ